MTKAFHTQGSKVVLTIILRPRRNHCSICRQAPETEGGRPPAPPSTAGVWIGEA